MWHVEETDLIVIGNGLAGLSFSLMAADPYKITIIGKGSLMECNSHRAQGGIAVPLDLRGDLQAHLEDTLVAGAGLSERASVQALLDKSHEAVRFLEEKGVLFDRDEGGRYRLGREGAHSRNRILHVGGDQTGKGIMVKLIEEVTRHPMIRVLEGTTALRLIGNDGRINGAVVERTGELPFILTGKAVVLAAGGLGDLYPYTTNEKGIAGEGMGIAYQAGAILRDMEFIQFHPTALNVPERPLPLISEAVRGEGGILLNDRGERFMEAVDERKELAPRDIVARAIDSQLKNGRKVFLDGRSIPSFADRFPTVTESCRRYGIDPEREMIPVVPAAHYAMGGVYTDLEGKSSLPGLYAIGEASSTGVHGANRLASNSLLEAVVYGLRAAESVRKELKELSSLPYKAYRRVSALPFTPREILDQKPPREAQMREAIREVMWAKAGINRDEKGLLEAKSLLFLIQRGLPSVPTAIGNSLIAALLIVEGALRRRESRGAHYRTDYPEKSGNPYHLYQGGDHEPTVDRRSLKAISH